MERYVYIVVTNTVPVLQKRFNFPEFNSSELTIVVDVIPQIFGYGDGGNGFGCRLGVALRQQQF